jgi:hypothetical protein
MCLLGSIAKLRQFFLDIVIDQNIERYRPAKSMLKVEPLPKPVEPAKRVSRVGYWPSVPMIFDLRQRCPSGVAS